MTLIEKLTETLSANENFTVNGKLLKNKVIEHGLKLDSELLSLIHSEEKLREFFFTEVGDMKVFDKDKFMKFVSNKQFLPDSYTMFKNKIGLATDNEYFYENSNVVVNFPYKECVLVGGQSQEDKKRNEIFWNTTLAPEQVDTLLEPKLLTNFKKYELNGINEVGEIQDTDNLIIKGNNLLALKLLKKRVEGQIKLVYIDPPYNTGSDSFEYNDSFNHATYLTFMKNRLEAAKDLLNFENGVIAVHCSFHEYAYLKVLMDEIFGQNNHKCTFNIRVRHEDRILTGDKEFNDVIEYILFYSKNETYKFPTRLKAKEDTDYIYEVEELAKGEVISLNGKEVEVFKPKQYKLKKVKPSSNNFKTISVRGSLREKNSSGRFYVKYLEPLIGEYAPLTLFKVPDMGDDMYSYRYFHLPKEGNKNGTYLQGKPTSSEVTKLPYANFYDFEKEYNVVAEEGCVDFRNGKKPEKLLKFIIELFTNEGDIVLDYHLGSATTCSVAHKLNRQYIGIEQMDYIETVSAQRLLNVINAEQTGISEDINWEGGGSFVYCELKELNKYYEKLIEESETKEALLETLNQILEKAALNYTVDKEKKEDMIAYIDNLEIKEVKIFLHDLLDPNQLYLNYSEMDDQTYNISENDKRLNKSFYKEV